MLTGAREKERKMEPRPTISATLAERKEENIWEVKNMDGDDLSFAMENQTGVQSFGKTDNNSEVDGKTVQFFQEDNTESGNICPRNIGELPINKTGDSGLADILCGQREVMLGHLEDFRIILMDDSDESDLELKTMVASIKSWNLSGCDVNNMSFHICLRFFQQFCSLVRRRIITRNLSMGNVFIGNTDLRIKDHTFSDFLEVVLEDLIESIGIVVTCTKFHSEEEKETWQNYIIRQMQTINTLARNENWFEAISFLLLLFAKMVRLAMSAVTMRYYYIGSSTDGTSLLESWNDIKKNVSTNEVSGLVFPNKMNWQNVGLIFVSFRNKGSNCMRESTVETIMTAGGNREETSQRTIIASQLLTELEDSPFSGRSNENKNQRKVSRPIDVTATAFTITNHIPLSS